MTDVVTFGEAMAALRGIGPLRLGATMQLSIAGSESNVAIGLARLGHTTQWVGRVGNDELGELVRRTLRAEGVDTTAVSIDDQRATGLMLFEQRIADIVRVSYYRAGSAGGAITAADILPSVTPDVRMLHLTGVTAALGPAAADGVGAAARRAHESGVAVSLDVNYRKRLWAPAAARDTLRPFIAHVDVLFASEDELTLVAADPRADPETVAHQLVADGVGAVVIKRGAAGATAYTSDGARTAPARTVHAVDVVGAGDAFVAGYLSATLDGQDVVARLDRGVSLGAFAVAQCGDWEGLPTREELRLLDVAPGATLR